MTINDEPNNNDSTLCCCEECLTNLEPEGFEYPQYSDEYSIDLELGEDIPY